MQVKPSLATKMITGAIKAKLVTMMKGSPGIGKSDIVRQIAKEYNLKVIDFRLSQCDPTDLAGFPMIVGSRADYVPMAHFPLEGDPLPINPETGLPYAGWLLFLDEATSALPAIQAAAYKLVLDRMVGSHHLHKNVAMVMAGNKLDDGAIVHEMSTALQSRLMHLELVVDQDEWIKWAEEAGIDHRITSHIKFKPGNLYNFKADHTDETYGCPRTWEFSDRILKNTDDGDVTRLPMLSGTLGEGLAREFTVFCKIFDELVTPKQIVANPEKIKVPTEPSVLFALTGSIAHNMNMDDAAAYMKFVTRLPAEFQVVCLRETIRRNKGLVAHPALHDWVVNSATALF